MHRTLWDTVIIGGGSAGLSAALMLGRARRRVLVVDSGAPRNRFAAHMHGTLGLEGLAPIAFLERGRAEARAYGVEFVHGEAQSVETAGDTIRVTLAEGSRFMSRTLIVASGLTDVLPEVSGVAERWGTSVIHCPYCHGWEVRDQRIGVLGVSAMSLHQVELVRQWSNRVTFFAAATGGIDAPTEQRIRARGVEILDEDVIEVLGDGTEISGVRLRGGRTVAIDALFVAPGALPHDEFLAPLALTRADSPVGSFIEVDPVGRTSHDRVWAAGNVVNPAANVPMSVGAGAATGAAVNRALVDDDSKDRGNHK